MDELPQGTGIVFLSLFLLLPAFIDSAPRVELQIAIRVAELPWKNDKPLQQGPTCTQAAAIDFAVLRTYQHNCQFFQPHHPSFMSPFTLCRGSEAGPGTPRDLSTPSLNSNPKLILGRKTITRLYSQWKENNPINSLACIENMNKALLQKHLKLCYIIDFMFMTAMVHYFPSLSLFIRFDS